MTRVAPNELRQELLGIHNSNAFLANSSSPRLGMFGKHTTQRLIVNGLQEKTIQTGFEKELGKYTLCIKMPEDGVIIKIISRYPPSADINNIPACPEDLVIYEDAKTFEVGCFVIPKYLSYHQYFGYPLVPTENLAKLRPGVFFAKDTVFADTPAKRENGGYATGVTANICLLSHPAVSEDGVLVSEEYLERNKFIIYETRTVEFGSSCFPLNIYGTEDKYQPFPEIGQYINDDGIIMALRTYEPLLAPVEMSIKNTQEVDYTFDNKIYGRANNPGKIIDIKIVKDNSDNLRTPSGIMDYMSKYSKGLLSYHNEIIETEKSLRYARRKKFGKDNLTVKPEFQRLIVESMAIVRTPDPIQKLNLKLLYRNDPLDEFRVTFTIAYEITPTMGFKISDESGGTLG